MYQYNLTLKVKEEEEKNRQEGKKKNVKPLQSIPWCFGGFSDFC